MYQNSDKMLYREKSRPVVGGYTATKEVGGEPGDGRGTLSLLVGCL